MSNRIVLIAIFFAVLSFNVICNQLLPVTDPVESNYALTAKEMLESGDWLSTQIYGKVWFDKPIMIYWLIAASFKLCGVNDFAARLPSALCGAATAGTAFWFSLCFYKRRQSAVMASLVLATSLQFWIISRGIVTDAALMLFFSLSMAAFYRWWTMRRQIWLDLSFAAAALAVLTKGPVGLVLPGLIIIAFSFCGGGWGWLKPKVFLRGLSVFLLIAAPWYLMMYLLHGDSFVSTFLGLHNYVRATVSEHPQDNVWYYYLVLLPVALLPWSGIMLRCLGRIRRQWNGPERFLWLWIGTIIAFYSVMATKYATYAYPALFPAALLIGDRLAEMVRFEVRRREWLWLTLPLMLQAIVFTFFAGRLENRHSELVYAVLCLSLFSTCVQQIKGKKEVFFQHTTVVSAIMTIVVLWGLIVPLVENRSAKDIVAISFPMKNEAKMIVSYGDYSTSAVFYSGKMIYRIDKSKNFYADAWAGKYTMPRIDMDTQFKNCDECYVLLKKRSLSSFKGESYSTSFIEIGQAHEMLLLKKETIKSSDKQE